MEKELKSYKFEKSIVELRKNSALTTYEYGEWKHQHLEEVNLVMKMHRETYLLSDFEKYFQKADLSCLQQPCVEDEHGWIFGRQEISNNGVNNKTALPHISIQETTRKLMREVSNELRWSPYSLVQFWAVGMNEDRLCLETSEQPFAVGSLDKGLAYFRKQCMERYYFVDELVGPLQRVFQSGQPETSCDIGLCFSTEFPLRDLALHCNLTEYLGLPVFDHQKKCIGVLEYVSQDSGFGMRRTIERALEAASLGSTPTHLNKLLTDPPRQVDGSRKLAEAEIVSALRLFEYIPQLFLVNVWITHTECDGTNSNICCMELFQSSDPYRWHRLPSNFRRRIQTRKGIVGMVLESENKSCFCRSSCDFSLADEPLAHISQRKRLDFCFAVCLQSSHTGDLLYVLEFFLFQGPANYEYVSSFLHNLFPIMVQGLISFRLASGQQLGDNLVVDVIEFPHRNHITSSGLNESCSSRFKFKTVVYGQQEPQYSINELPLCDPDFMDTVPSVEQAEPSNPRERSIGKRKVKNTGRLNLTLEDLRPHFGKPLAQVEMELGAARSTIERACKDFGISRWPSKKNLKNPFLFEAAGTSHDNSSSNIPPPDMLPPPTNAKTPPQPLINLMPESEIVTVKAKYEDKILKIKLCLSSTMNKLVEEVGRRLDLEKGSFELRYLDEDDDNILIACDDDLQLCFKDQTAMGRTTMVVSVQLILNPM